MKNYNSVSVIVSTYNGRNKLPSLIESLEKQTYNEFETFIMVDGSSDDTMKYLANISPKLSKFDFQYQENQGRAQVKNSAVQYVNGDLLIFIDDDMNLDKNCIYEHIFFHQKHQNSISSGTAYNWIPKSGGDLFKYKSELSYSWILKGESPVETTIENLFLTSANLSMLKSTFQFVNGFDAKLSDHEDFDLAIRAYLKGIKVYFNTSCIGYHKEEISFGYLMNRRIQYIQSFLKYKNSHPEYADFMKKREYQSRKLDQILGLKSWELIIDNFNVLLLLPKKLRYRLYGGLLFRGAMGRIEKTQEK